PVVLLHGYTDSCRSFEPVLAHLPKSVRAFALTQRGHGDADRPADGYRPEDLANDLASWMDFAGLRSAVIVGHSMGAHVAQRLAIDHSERVRGLVLVGAFRELASNAAIRELEADVARLSDPVDASFVRAFQQSTVHQLLPPTFLDMVVGESLKVPHRVWKAALDGLIGSDLSPERFRIARPTLLVWGTADALVPRGDQEALLATISSSDLLEYSAAGHATHWDEPERFAVDLTAFVRRL
ncbi:MAG: alpha/beta hydrolase, partial [Polyangiaceae bacterium]|nr:alpha/beta hydrolase [Polyangiaceae bacterium]